MDFRADSKKSRKLTCFFAKRTCRIGKPRNLMLGSPSENRVCRIVCLLIPDCTPKNRRFSFPRAGFQRRRRSAVQTGLNRPVFRPVQCRFPRESRRITGFPETRPKMCRNRPVVFREKSPIRGRYGPGRELNPGPQAACFLARWASPSLEIAASGEGGTAVEGGEQPGTAGGDWGRIRQKN